MKNEKKNFSYHLCGDNQLIYDENFLREKLIENKTHLQQIFIYFYQQIANGLDLFNICANEFLFQQYPCHQNRQGLDD
jgi:hypothetical protein